eukprot:4002381-Lingulodinium_polyedra.AAC.1
MRPTNSPGRRSPCSPPAWHLEAQPSSSTRPSRTRSAPLPAYGGCQRCRPSRGSAPPCAGSTSA